VSYEQRLQGLRGELASLPGAVVAFSGGVDSTMLLHACVGALGDRVLAVTADSPSLPRHELAEARSLAQLVGARHLVVQTRELLREGYRRNAPDRCYFCKSELFDVVAEQLRTQVAPAAWPVLYGAIADDLADHRPGGRAAAERGVLAPLARAGLTKDDVRRYSRDHALPTAAKPSWACLASRVPYGTEVDAALLGRIERAEDALRRLGYRQFRVRHHGDVARVELPAEDLARAVGRDRAAIDAGIREAGYTYVALDLRGFRSGSMNEVLG
jgi:uncharacterized protein